MIVYLVQHGDAKSAEEDPARPLSKIGESKALRMAGWAAARDLKVDHIYHSGKLRARQTAEILARSIGLKCAVEEREGLNPGDDVKPVASWIERMKDEEVESLMLVGHLPLLDKLASLLVSGEENAHVVAFRNAGIVALVSGDEGYSIEWIVTPELVESPFRGSL